MHSTPQTPPARHLAGLVVATALAMRRSDDALATAMIEAAHRHAPRKAWR